MSFLVEKQQILGSIAEGFNFLGNSVNPSLYPFPWFSTLHAARISLAFQSNTRRLGTHNALGWKGYIGGFCLMSWGGMVFSHILLNLPPPVLYAPQPWVNYISVHLFLTFVFSLMPFFLVDTDLLSTVDLVLFPLDAMLRVNAVVGTLAHLSPGSPSYEAIKPALINSSLFHFIIGCTASAGGGATAATLGVWTPTWGSGGFTPVFLKKGPGSPLSGALSTLDIWGGGLVAVVYGFATSHTAFRPFLSILSPYFYAFTLVDVHNVKQFSSVESKSIAAAVLMALFGIRAVAAKVQASAPAPANKKR
ncbi:hypothetical protein J3R30DRAFT_3444721 [Lentinula aciculospora]|uniref:Uncharacterized protein n=1 Tax=Lentinula aciculospora TaxID=153920 RepID=A0A9W9DUR3_9AGAR|nr:hypothetical protein J3R30DRAFT_3444721 [Lentinula aciculospora]